MNVYRERVRGHGREENFGVKLVALGLSGDCLMQSAGIFLLLHLFILPLNPCFLRIFPCCKELSALFVG